MTYEYLKRVRDQQPFQPLRLHMAGGRSIRVTHPENMLVPSKPGRTFVVYMPEEDNFEFIDVLLVESVELVNRKPRGRNGNGRSR